VNVDIDKDETEGTQSTEQTEEERSAEEAEAERAFAAGYSKVSGAEDTKTTDSTTETTEATERSAAEVEAQAKAAEAKAKAEAEAKAVADAEAEREKEWEGVPAGVRARLEKLEGLPGTIDKLAGHVGGFKRQLDSVIATAQAAAKSQGAATPTASEVKAAMASPEAWGKFAEEFEVVAEALKPVMDAEITALRAEIAKAKPAEAQTVDVEAITAAAEERALVRLKYPDWKTTVKTPEFDAWLKSQPEDMVARTKSASADDAIVVLDGYTTSRQASAEADAARQKREKRLAGAVTPKGVQGAPPAIGISDEEAFARGFKKVAGHK